MKKGDQIENIIVEIAEFRDESEWLKGIISGFQASLSAHRSESDTLFHVALSGGNTPGILYSELANCDLPWNAIHWWVGDERFVPLDHHTRNERMIRDTLNSSRHLTDTNFSGWGWCADNPAEMARLFEAKMRLLLPHPTHFDLAIQGIGSDGHTASLFPNTQALDETVRAAVSNNVSQLNTTRLTVTKPVLDASKELWFLVRGREKSHVINDILQRTNASVAGSISAHRQKIWWLAE